jgi:hypothetical protein
MTRVCGAVLHEPGRRWQCALEPHSSTTAHWSDCWEDVDRRRGNVVYYVQGDREWRDVTRDSDRMLEIIKETSKWRRKH